MSYVKTQWVNNTTPIDENNLNKIEQGIYDNSLVVEAVTNTLNPTDTETYKTAELTEGQITDVIGVNDIIIKGQTSQDGEPTPSSPVDVNVVSGSNVVSTSNKNLFNAQIQAGTYGQAIYSVARDGLITQSVSDNSSWSTTQTRNFYLDAGTYTINCIGKGTEKRLQIRNLTDNVDIIQTQSEKGTFTLTERKLLAMKTWGSSAYPASYYVQIEKGSEATTYEPHQSKELPLDLPVENLCTPYNFVNATILSDGQITEGTDRFATDYIKVKGNAQYRLNFKDGSNINFYGVAYYDADKTFISRNTKNGGNNLTFTTDSNTVYIRMFGQPQIGTIFTEESFNTYKIQLEQGSKANAYTPYGTEPIELCKIGNYQDYFYKSGSKWYLHKEVNKITSYNGETITTSYISTTGELSTGAKVYYALATATNTEITNTTLISQLEAIYNAPLYEQTNITQTNNDLPMVLDITACKDNINGIKAFIRK